MNTIETIPVAAIENGTVIDHIEAGKAALLLQLFQHTFLHKNVAMGMNLPSKKIKTKDLIKIADWEISDEEAEKIAILAPHATINIIKGYKPVRKSSPHLPEEILGLLICPNPTCISNHEESTRRFLVQHERNKVFLCCHYCERVYLQNEIKRYVL